MQVAKYFVKSTKNIGKIFFVKFKCRNAVSLWCKTSN